MIMRVIMAALLGGVAVALFIIFLNSPTLVATFKPNNTVLYWQSNKHYDDPKLRFAKYYGDHMVLQQNHKNIIWGFSSGKHVGKAVTLTVRRENAFEKYDSFVENYSETEGIWSVQVKARPAGGPYEISVAVLSAKVVLRDVLFGDVWLCSGQSNMQFTASMMFNASQEISLSSKYPDIRLFTAADVQSEKPLTDLADVAQPWSRASPEAVGGPEWVYFSGVCWEYGRNLYDKLQYPIGLVATTWGGTPIEAWSSTEALKKCDQLHDTGRAREVFRSYTSLHRGPGDRSVLYDAMINPFLNLTITGVIWYQGESNAGSRIYDCRFQAMIEDWRKKFHEGSRGETDEIFPFGFVQLAAYGNNTQIGPFPSLRWQQTYNVGYVPNQKLPNTFMAVAIDLPDFSSPYGPIHPRDKETVGARLARSGLAVAYELPSGGYQGPFPSALHYNKNASRLNIEYDNRKVQLTVKDTFGFELCCSDNKTPCNETDASWIGANISGVDVWSLTLSFNCGKPYITGLRYLWAESPCQYLKCPVYSKDTLLPAPPFVFSGLFYTGHI